MSLPCGFTNSKDYFEQCIEFFEKHCWIYKTSNTCFIQNSVCDNFPLEWKTYFTTVKNDNLNKFPSRQLQTNYSTLDDFLQELNLLIPTKIPMSFPNINYKLKKISKKKEHEITRLSSLIKKLCVNEIDVLIDFGSGLGYLSELLHSESSFKIIGLESDIQRVQTSRERQAATYPYSKNQVFFKDHFITEESNEFITNEVNSLFPDLNETSRLAIIGLHSCADLTITSMKLFFAMKNIQKLIIMPCCYHKLETKTNQTDDGFKNFPLSTVLKTSVSKIKSFRSFNRPFLRLACQQTAARWMKQSEKEHHEHGIEMFCRGVAEAIINEDETVVKSKRKKIQQFQQFKFSELTETYNLHCKNTTKQIDWRTEHEERFIETMEKYPNGPKLAEGLTCLQTAMQQLCENVVLYDRICFMEEQALKINLKISVKFEKIMDEILSPRGYVLIAEKL